MKEEQLKKLQKIYHIQISDEYYDIERSFDNSDDIESVKATILDGELAGKTITIEFTKGE